MISQYFGGAFINGGPTSIEQSVIVEIGTIEIGIRGRVDDFDIFY